ncbi:MAG: DNA repair protein RecO [Acidobacteria bacterium]|nr:DNA repair protein RecO [Acidobacteriota bacterium]
MPLHTAEALILRTYKLAEADRIVVFLTRDRGKRRGVAKGARRTRSRFGGALEPLTRVNVAYFEKEQRELVRLNYAEVLSSPLAWPAGAEALGHLAYFAELIDEWAPEADPNERLYRLGVSVGDALANGAPVDRLARYFEYWLLRLQGVYPSVLACHVCASDLTDRGARIALHERVFVCCGCGRPAGGPRLSREALEFLRAAASVAPDRLSSLDLPRRAERELEVAHRVLISAHLEKELKSARVLRELA